MSGTTLASAAPLQDNWGGYAISEDGTKSNTVYTMFDGLTSVVVGKSRFLSVAMKC